MVTMAANKIFVDANLLVYARATQSPWHGAAVDRLDGLRLAGDALWTSRQIFREYLSAMSRPGTVIPPFPMSSLILDVQGFSTQFQIAEDGPAVTAEHLNLLATIPCGGKQIHDANIVATMLAHGIPNIVTHNTADFARFSGLITILPMI